jgi:hypothetical protein
MLAAFSVEPAISPVHERCVISYSLRSVEANAWSSSQSGCPNSGSAGCDGSNRPVSGGAEPRPGRIVGGGHATD